MILRLIKHSWSQFWRSPTLTQNMVQTVLLGLFAVYMIANMLALGFFLGWFIKEQFPEQELLSVAGGLLFYYFLVDIITRYFLQKFPTIAIKPYMTLPIKKGTIANNLLVRSLGSFFNFLPLFFILPFFFKDVLPAYPVPTAIGFVLFSIGMVFFNNYIVFAIDKVMAIKSMWPGLLLIGIIGLFFLEYNGYVALLPFFQQLASTIFQNPLLSAIPLLGIGLLHYLLHGFLRNNLTLEQAKGEQSLYGSTLPAGLFERFGAAGDLMDLELKLMLRSKRSRSYIIMGAVFLFYPLLFIDTLAESTYLLLIISWLITGIVAMNHGQLLLSWNSLHFDLLQSRGHTIADIFQAKYYILVLASLIAYLLCLPYLFISTDLVLANTAMVFYNMTVSIFAYMWLASYNSLRIDPNEGSAFNLSGFGAAHYLIGFPLVGMPCLLYWIGSLFGGNIGGLFLIGIIGLICLIFHKSLIQLCVRNFKKNRYRIGAAFRKSQ